jgi:hypothetical protein
VIRGVVIAAALLGATHVAHAKGCHETSKVVGLEHCSRFGDWSRDQHVPALWVDVGGGQHHYLSDPFTLHTTQLQSAQLGATDLSTTETSPFDVRILGGIGGIFYTGLELGGGFLTTKPRYDGVTPTTGGGGELLAVAGVHVGIWRFSVGGEVAAGEHGLTMMPDCGGATCPKTDETTQSHRELEMRANADLWITPHYSLGASVGKSLVDPDDARFMIYLGIHVRAFDGMR